MKYLKSYKIFESSKYWDKIKYLSIPDVPLEFPDHLYEFKNLVTFILDKFNIKYDIEEPNIFSYDLIYYNIDTKYGKLKLSIYNDEDGELCLGKKNNPLDIKFHIFNPNEFIDYLFELELIDMRKIFKQLNESVVFYNLSYFDRINVIENEIKKYNIRYKIDIKDIRYTTEHSMELSRIILFNYNNIKISIIIDRTYNDIILRIERNNNTRKDEIIVSIDELRKKLLKIFKLDINKVFKQLNESNKFKNISFNEISKLIKSDLDKYKIDYDAYNDDSRVYRPVIIYSFKYGDLKDYVTIKILGKYGYVSVYIETDYSKNEVDSIESFRKELMKIFNLDIGKVFKELNESNNFDIMDKEDTIRLIKDELDKYKILYEEIIVDLLGEDVKTYFKFNLNDYFVKLELDYSFSDVVESFIIHHNYKKNNYDYKMLKNIDEFRFYLLKLFNSDINKVFKQLNESNEILDKLLKSKLKGIPDEFPIKYKEIEELIIRILNKFDIEFYRVHGRFYLENIIELNVPNLSDIEFQITNSNKIEINLTSNEILTSILNTPYEFISILYNIGLIKLNKVFKQLNESNDSDIFDDLTFDEIKEYIKNKLDDFNIIYEIEEDFSYKYNVENERISFTLENGVVIRILSETFGGFRHILVLDIKNNKRIRVFNKREFIGELANSFIDMNKIFKQLNERTEEIIRKDRKLDDDSRERELIQLYIKEFNFYKTKKSLIEKIYNDLNKDIDIIVINKLVGDNHFLKDYIDLLQKKRDVDIQQSLIDKNKEEISNLTKTISSGDISNENINDLQLKITNLKNENNLIEKKLRHLDIKKMFFLWDKKMKKTIKDLKNGKSLIVSELTLNS